MSRSKISSPANSLISDDGGALIGVRRGEQVFIDIQASWLINMTGYNVHANIIEAINDGLGGAPTGVKPGGVQVLLSIANGYIRNVNDGDNRFIMVIPWNLAEGMLPQPTPDNSIFAYIELEIGEPGTGDESDPLGDAVPPENQVWKPLSGLVEISYSPTEL